MDEARAELPLTADKQDTFPVGLALETGSTHKLVIGKYKKQYSSFVEFLFKTKYKIK